MQGMQGFVQVPCIKCRTVVWISPAAGVGYCPQCHTPNQLQAGAGAPPMGAPGAPSMGQPGMPGAPNPGAGMPPQAATHPMNPVLVRPGGFPAGGMPGMGGGLTRGKMVGMIAGAVALAIVGVGVSVVKGMAKKAVFGGGGKDSVGYLQLGIDPKAAVVDKMIPSTQGLATRWKSDAVFWSMNARGVRADGTMDLTSDEAGAVIEYISLNGVQSLAKSVREGTVKEFSFNSVGLNFASAKTPTEAWTGVTAPDVPRCSIKQLASELASKGLTGAKTVRVNFDPKFAGLVNLPEQAWRVMGDDPKIDAYFSMATCKELKK